MLLVLSQDDPALTQAARQAQQAHPGVFGAVVVAWQQQMPQLMQGESLFVTAHGVMKGDDGGPVIGDATQAHWVNAQSFVSMLLPAFPANYAADVYISACESANVPRGAFSFAEVFKAFLFSQRRGLRNVYGQPGAVGLGIPLPGAPGWVRA